jgi:hypothetical protein
VTQTIKSDADTLLALGSQMGLQGFEATRGKVVNAAVEQSAIVPKPSTAANRDRSDASTIMALAKSARLQCVADEGAL